MKPGFLDSSILSLRFVESKCFNYAEAHRPSPLMLGIPWHDTFGRVFSRLDSVEFYASLQSWTKDVCSTIKGETIAMDGKTLRGSFDTASGKSALHSVSAWACGLRLCLGLKYVDDKSNEIPAVQKLIEVLDLKGSVVTADAMHCQKETAKAIVAKEADYILFAMGNQPSLQDALHDAIFKRWAVKTTLSGAHAKRKKTVIALRLGR